jgi:hypothetical protein
MIGLLMGFSNVSGQARPFNVQRATFNVFKADS